MAAKEPARAISRAMVMGARVVRVMSGWHRSIVPTTGRSNGPTGRHWIGVVEGGTMRGLRRRNALFIYCLSDGLSDLALGE